MDDWKSLYHQLKIENQGLQDEIEFLREELKKTSQKYEEASRRIKELNVEITMSPIQD